MLGDKSVEFASVKAPVKICNSNNDNQIDAILEHASTHHWRSRKPGCTFVRQPTQAFVMDDVLQRLKEALAGRYTVERQIGRGGMSVVYLAQDLRNKRNVALKVLRPELSKSIGVNRFLREIKIAANLEHPHILPLFDSGEAEGLLYYTMPFVEGESLRDRLRREGPLPIGDAIKIAKEVGEALSNAHDHGVVHRDIKPENILLTGGIARVADFGIARARTEASEYDSVSDANIAIGTPEYMSPEQAGGSDTLDGRTDVYSLGCVLYEMLAGEPPFTGRTVQAIIARHLGEKVPTLTVLRQGVPLKVIKVIEKSLAKVPADRYATAKKFVEALDRAQKRVGFGAVAVAAVAAVVVTWTATGLWDFINRPPPTVVNRDWVMGFPLVTMGLSELPPVTGDMAALRLGSALEGTDPLIWKWGWDWLTPEQRQDTELVTAQTMDDIARSRGARFRISGSLMETGHEASVTLFLHDVLLDSTLVQRTVRGPSHPDSVLSLALQAGRDILPALIEPGREVDYAAFENRDLAATALWMQGELSYRRSRFDSALEFYERAVGRDSALAMAALKGAQSAGWLKKYDQAEHLVDRALERADVLPARHLYFANGLKGWFTGMADSAVYWFNRCLVEEPGWREAHYALGEVYYHLLPAGLRLDTLAEANFEASIQADSGFAPPLYHMAQIAIRRGDIEGAARMIDRFGGFSPESRFLPPLMLALECVRHGSGSIAWESEVERDADVAYKAARTLSVSASHPACAEAGLRALLASGNSTYEWGAFLGLQGLLAALGRNEELVTLVDSAVSAGNLAAMTLYLIDAIAGADVEEKALDAERYGDQWGEQYELFGGYPDRYMWIGWLYGTWHSHRGDSSEVRSLRDILSERAVSSGDEEIAHYAAALDAHLDLLRSDTTRAVNKWLALSSIGISDSITGVFGLTLPTERLRLAEVLCAQGRYEECLGAAAVFDHPGPVIFMPFLPASLALRYEASVQLGWVEMADEFRMRLERLGRLEMLSVGNRGGD